MPLRTYVGLTRQVIMPAMNIMGAVIVSKSLPNSVRTVSAISLNVHVRRDQIEQLVMFTVCSASEDLETLLNLLLDGL